MKAVILAGGTGNRLHPIDSDVPKAMLPVFDRPLIEHTIIQLSRHGIREVVVALSYRARDIVGYFGDGARWGVKIRYSVESRPMGTAGALGLLRDIIDETFVVVNGDVVQDIDITRMITEHKAAQARITFAIARSETPEQYGVVKLDDSGAIAGFVEKPRSSDGAVESVSAGVYIMEPDVLASVSYGVAANLETDLLPRMAANGGELAGSVQEFYWRDIADLVSYRAAHKDILAGKAIIEIPATHIGEGIWLGDNVTVHPSAELIPPVFLGKNVTVRPGAVVRGGSIIGENTLIDDSATVANSIIGQGTWVGAGSEIDNCVIAGGSSVSSESVVRDYACLAAAQSPGAAAREIASEVRV